jgi:hypothetical protein
MLFLLFPPDPEERDVYIPLLRSLREKETPGATNIALLRS